MRPKSIQIIKSPRSRSIRMRLDKELNLIIHAGRIFSDAQIQSCIDENKEWIQKKLESLSRQNNAIQNILDAHVDEILCFGIWKKISTLHLDLTTHLSLKKELLEILQKQVKIFSVSMGLKAGKVSIRPNHYVLGSCNHNNDLSFSLLLYFAPPSLIEYVVIHELAHIRFKDHSRGFWSFVSSFCPDYQEKRYALRQNMPLYRALYRRIFKSASVQYPDA